MSSNAEQAFGQLHRRVQKWIVDQGWDTLRPIQQKAVEPVLAGNTDVLISASTASGKTEAAFLPVFSKLVDTESSGIGALYISPLKALINDQERRLTDLGEHTGIAVTPWHGDVKQSKKNALRQNPEGVVLITPESLEGYLLNNSSWSRGALKNLSYIVIDEFHAFIDSVRGVQLMSLLCRIEFLVQRTIPRIGLSATLGDMEAVANLLRGNRSVPTHIIKGESSSVKPSITYKGSIYPLEVNGSKKKADRDQETNTEIAADIYDNFLNKFNLVFANSRADTERLTSTLSDNCERVQIENQFFNHHGSLSKDHREHVENRLQQGKHPTTVVCTSTLELGIDIGEVDDVAQIDCPHSVASLRQRVGRSGRRNGEPSLRLYITENEIPDADNQIDRLRITTFQSIAIIDLLLEGEYEPPNAACLHLSTFVQQTLSVIGQYRSVRADQVFDLLVKKGPFGLITVEMFKSVLQALKDKDLITQMSNGAITIGAKGEDVIGHYSFYAAFQTPIEYTLECEGKVLGTLPILQPLSVDQSIIFGGKRWQVKEVLQDKNRVKLLPAGSGQAPRFSSGGPEVNDIVRQRMKKVYQYNDYPSFLDGTGQSTFKDGKQLFNALGLASTSVVSQQSTHILLPWMGDRVCNTLAAMLKTTGQEASHTGGGMVEVKNSSAQTLQSSLSDLANSTPTLDQLIKTVKRTAPEKFDEYLSDELAVKSFASRAFDIKTSINWINQDLL